MCDYLSEVGHAEAEEAFKSGERECQSRFAVTACRPAHGAGGQGP